MESPAVPWRMHYMQKKQGDTVSSLTDLLDRIEEVANEKEKASLDDVLDVVGHRSFGPLLLLAGLITSMPLVGDIPGVSAAMGIFVIFISVQLLMRREHFWLPDWLLDLDVDPAKLQKGVDLARTPARKIDGVLDARMERMTRGPGFLAVAAVCTAVGLVMPVMEFIPFSATAAGVTLLAYGLALVFHDGWLVLAAHAVAGGTFAFVIIGLV